MAQGDKKDSTSKLQGAVSRQKNEIWRNISVCERTEGMMKRKSMTSACELIGMEVLRKVNCLGRGERTEAVARDKERRRGL